MVSMLKSLALGTSKFEDTTFHACRLSKWKSVPFFLKCLNVAPYSSALRLLILMEEEALL